MGVLGGRDSLVSGILPGTTECSNRRPLVTFDAAGTKINFNGILESLLWCPSASVTGR